MVSCVPWQPNMACSPEWDTLDPDLQERSTALAWSAIRLLTGGMVGGCPVLLRPCASAPCHSCVNELRPYLSGGVWFNATPCGGWGCSCDPLSEVVFPGRVAQVTEVRQDGVVVVPSRYRLDGNRLLRIDGIAWLACQDMTLPDTQPGTLSVAYVPGTQPGADGLWAVGVLAYEFSKACTGGKCRLPASVTSVTRQGVTMDFDNSMFSNGLVGIREVDAWLLSVNPNKLKIPPRVWSPDVAHGRIIGVSP